MRLLCDQNVPQNVVDLFVIRGHDVKLSRDSLLESSPDQLLAIAGTLDGLVIVTHDKDFKNIHGLLPQGYRSRTKGLYGRIALGMREALAAKRLEDVVDEIEFHYAKAVENGRPLFVSVTLDAIQVIHHVRKP